jgi:RND family efflux transporter MFP subunit
MNLTLISIAVGWLVVVLLNIGLLPPRLTPTVTVETLQQAPMPLIVSAPGAVQAKRSVIVKAEFDGPVLQKRFKEGDTVKQGDLLLEIGRDKIQQDYEGKRYALKNAQSDLRKAFVDVKLQRTLYEKQAVARSSVDDAERALERARQQVEIAKSAFRVEEERWNRNRVTALFDGTVVKDAIEDELTVTAGKEVLILADISELAVRARVNELEIRDIRVGQNASIGIQAVNAKPLKGTVRAIGSRAESVMVPEIPVFLSVDSVSATRLLPNMTADVRIFVGQTAPGLSVPISALAGSSGRNYVWLVDNLGRLRKRDVKVGKTNPERAEILEGLSVGQRVCVKIQLRFADGLKVRSGG